MPDFTTKLKKKMRSAPPVSLYLLEPVLQAEYQRFMPDFTTKKQKTWAAFRLYLYVFWNRFCRQSTSAYQISYIFLVSFGTIPLKRIANCVDLFERVGGSVPHIYKKSIFNKQKCSKLYMSRPRGGSATSSTLLPYYS